MSSRESLTRKTTEALEAKSNQDQSTIQFKDIKPNKNEFVSELNVAILEGDREVDSKSSMGSSKKKYNSPAGTSSIGTIKKSKKYKEKKPPKQISPDMMHLMNDYESSLKHDGKTVKLKKVASELKRTMDELKEAYKSDRKKKRTISFSSGLKKGMTQSKIGLKSNTTLLADSSGLLLNMFSKEDFTSNFGDVLNECNKVTSELEGIMTTEKPSTVEDEISEPVRAISDKVITFVKSGSTIQLSASHPNKSIRQMKNTLKQFTEIIDECKDLLDKLDQLKTEHKSLVKSSKALKVLFESMSKLLKRFVENKSTNKLLEVFKNSEMSNIRMPSLDPDSSKLGKQRRFPVVLNKAMAELENAVKSELTDDDTGDASSEIVEISNELNRLFFDSKSTQRLEKIVNESQKIISETKDEAMDKPLQALAGIIERFIKNEDVINFYRIINDTKQKKLDADPSVKDQPTGILKSPDRIFGPKIRLSDFNRISMMPTEESKEAEEPPEKEPTLKRVSSDYNKAFEGALKFDDIIEKLKRVASEIDRIIANHEEAIKSNESIYVLYKLINNLVEDEHIIKFNKLLHESRQSTIFVEGETGLKLDKKMDNLKKAIYNLHKDLMERNNADFNVKKLKETIEAFNDEKKIFLNERSTARFIRIIEGCKKNPLEAIVRDKSFVKFQNALEQSKKILAEVNKEIFEADSIKKPVEEPIQEVCDIMKTFVENQSVAEISEKITNLRQSAMAFGLTRQLSRKSAELSSEDLRSGRRERELRKIPPELKRMILNHEYNMKCNIDNEDDRIRSNDAFKEHMKSMAELRQKVKEDERMLKSVVKIIEPSKVSSKSSVDSEQSEKVEAEEEEEDDEIQEDFFDLNEFGEMDEDIIEKLTRKVKCKIPKNYPFKLVYTFGFNPNIPIKNLTSPDRNVLFFTCSWVGVFYDYIKKEMSFTQCHPNPISSTSSDKSGKWLATADYGNDNVINILDTINRKLILTIFNPYPFGTLIVNMSYNAKFLTSVGENMDNWIIDFWLWTYGNYIPDATHQIEKKLNYGMPRSIAIHPNNEAQFVVVFERAALFFEWDDVAKKMSAPTIPQIKHLKKFGDLNRSSYIAECHECFITTNNGYILIFGNTLYSKPFNEEPLDNKKLFIKAVQITKSKITCIKPTDGCLVVGDTSGKVFIFDKQVRLLYWTEKLDWTAICSISCDRFYTKTESSFSSDVVKKIEVKTNCLIDASLKAQPLCIRNFCVSTVDSNIYFVDLMKKVCVPLFYTSNGHVVAIEVHDQFPYLIIAYKLGQLSLFNFETYQQIISTMMPNSDDGAVVTILRYSKNSLHLACGRTNGEIWILEPILLTPKRKLPFKPSYSGIVDMIFSNDSLQLASYDSNRTVFLFTYNISNDVWTFRGKMRSHYDDIKNILFTPTKPHRLYTIGNDRYIVQYNNCNFKHESDQLGILLRERVDQKDYPKYFIYYPVENTKYEYFLMADDKHKYKILNSSTNMCMSITLGPAYGFFERAPVLKMKMLPNNDNKYLIFANKKFIGLQILPLDGNPFKYVSCMGHPSEMLDFRTTSDGKYLFTFGRESKCVFKWTINTESVERACRWGGKDLEPYYSVLEGGKKGWLFREMQDLFYYVQILNQGEDSIFPRVITDSIYIDDIPDLVRACGYYPSNYEIENMIVDIKYRDFEKNEALREKITFVDFVKLYINHIPVYGYSLKDLKKAFENFANGDNISLDNFIDLCTSTGENFMPDQLEICLSRLLRRDPNNFPKSVNVDSFVDEILGIDMLKNEPK